MSRTSAFIVTLVSSILPATMPAQNPAPEPLQTVATWDGDIGGFMGFEVRAAEVDGSSGAFTGGEAALLLGRRLSLGLAGYGWTGGDVRPPPGVDAGGLRMGYGGVRIGYALRPQRVVHGTLELLFGGGGAQWPGVERDDVTDSDGFLVLEPAIGAEVNLTPFLRFGLGVSYRHIAGATLPGLDERDLGGIAVRVGVRAGRF